MYDVKDDKRCRQSAARLKQGLLDCLKKDSFDHITVTDITQSSGVSRATFYRMFNSPIELLEYICDELAVEITSKMYGFSADDWERFVLVFFQSWFDNADVVEGLINSRRYDLIEETIIRYKRSLLPGGFNFLQSEDADYVDAIHIASLCSILYIWVRHGKKETPEHLLEIYKTIKNNT